VRRHKPPSQTWPDLPRQPREVHGFRRLFYGADHLLPSPVCVSAAGARPAAHLHFGVTDCPTAEWTGQQLREAFPWETATRYLLRDRDRIFGADFVEQVKAMGIKQVLSAPRSPWQRAYGERLIGTIRRECLDHVIVCSEASLSRHLRRFADYHHRSRTHLACRRIRPDPRPVQPPEAERIVAIPEVGGLHHRLRVQVLYRVALGGVLATDGGILFAASCDGNLVALDKRNGKLLWQFQTGAAIDSSPDELCR
jgi:hypothetical protein